MPPCQQSPPAVLDLLRKYDTPTICNVVELFDLRPRTAATWTPASRRAIRSCRRWSASPARRPSAPRRRRGPAMSTPASTEQVAAFAELPGPAVVVFQDLDHPPSRRPPSARSCVPPTRRSAPPDSSPAAPAATSTRSRRCNFPCFTSGTICAHGYCHIPPINVPVHVGGVADPPRRPAARRPQRRDDDPHGDRLRGGPRLCRLHGRRGDRARLSEIGRHRSERIWSGTGGVQVTNRCAGEEIAKVSLAARLGRAAGRSDVA